MASCSHGGGGSGGARPETAPIISDLWFSPPAVYVSASPAVFTGQVSFLDPDGDVASVTITIVDAGGATVVTATESVQGAAGVTRGTLQGAITAGVTVAGNYTIQVFVTDATGLQSNTLGGFLRIVAFPWTSRRASPTQREHMASAVLNGLVHVVGGQRTDLGTPGPVTAVMETYDPASDTWAPAPAMPTARTGLVAAVANGKLYAIGGSVDGFGTETGVVEEFDPVTQSWRSRAQMPTPRCFAAGASVGTRILVVGGRTLGGAAVAVVEDYDPVADSWSAAAPLAAARSDLAAVESDGLLYAVGGYGSLLTQWLGTVEAYDPGTGAWTSRPPMPTARSQLTLAAFGGRLLAAGGENVERALAMLEGFEAAANAWNSLTPSPVAFTRAAASIVGERMYVIGNGLTFEYDPANELRFQ